MAKRQQKVAIFEEELAEIVQPNKFCLADSGPFGQGVLHADNGRSDDNHEVQQGDWRDKEPRHDLAAEAPTVQPGSLVLGYRGTVGGGWGCSLQFIRFVHGRMMVALKQKQFKVSNRCQMRYRSAI